MKFSIWVEKTRAVKAELARNLGISRQSIHNLLNGSKPKPETMRDIERMSDGKVTLKDWCE